MSLWRLWVRWFWCLRIHFCVSCFGFYTSQQKENNTLNKILAGLLALLGVSGASAQANTPHQIDPKTILFSTPTISNDLAPIETLSDTPSGEIFSFHEDDWSQLEFFPKSQLPIIQRLLSEYKSFEEQNREHYGWRSKKD